EVYYAEQLFAEALEHPEARDWVCDHMLNERMVGVRLAQRAREWIGTADPSDVTAYLIGGVTRDDLKAGVGLLYESNDPGSMLLSPLPNFLFQRDPSCWIYGGVTLNPMAKPARKRETMLVETIYRFHPMFAENGGVKVWFGGTDQDWGLATVEGGDVQP